MTKEESLPIDRNSLDLGKRKGTYNYKVILWIKGKRKGTYSKRVILWILRNRNGTNKVILWCRKKKRGHNER